MELTQLNYFIEAARTENLSRAAENLHISQPSLSKAISRLEEELGTELFRRSGRRVALNADGRRFLRQIAPSVDALQEARVQFSGTSRNAAHRLTVGVWGESGALTNCLRAFRREHPEVFFDLRSHIERIVRPDIRDFDLLLYPEGEEYYRKYRGETLLTEPYLLAVRAGPQTAGKAAIDAAALPGFPMVSLEGEAAAEQLLLRKGIRLAVAAQTDDRVLQKQMVSAGLGACLVAESESRIFADDPAIDLVRVSGAQLQRQLSICFKRDKLLTELGQDFRRFVRAYYGLG